MRSTDRPRTTTLATLLCLVLMLVGTTDVLAQDGGRGGGRGARGDRGMTGGRMFGRAMQPEFVRRDMTLFTNELGLDEGQQTIVRALLLDYETAFATALEANRERFADLRPDRPEQTEEVREERRELFREMREIRDAVRQDLRALREQTPDGEELDPEAIGKIRERLEPFRERMQAIRPPRPEAAEMARLREGMGRLATQWSEERAALRREFLASLRAILSEDQQTEWPGFDRALTRDKTMRLGRLSGESVDLNVVMNQIGLAADDLWSIQDEFEAYEIDLDTALHARNTAIEEGMLTFLAAMMSRDWSKAADQVEREYGLRTDVRDVNERYVDVLAGRLGETVSEEVARELQSGFRQRAYPRVFRTTWMQRTLQSAQAIEGLSDETLAAIMSYEEQYLAELEPMNRQLIAVTRTHEPREAVDRMRRRAEGNNNDQRWFGFNERNEDDPIRDAYRKRTELDARYRRTLESLLTAEQIALLPTRPEREGRGRGGWGDRGRGDRGARRGGDRGDRRQRGDRGARRGGDRGERGDGRGRGGGRRGDGDRP